MSEEQLRVLQQKLWAIADVLRGKMNADEFRDYILGFIFYKYLSEKVALYGDKVLASDNLIYSDLDINDDVQAEYIDAVKDSMIPELGYFLTPDALFHNIAVRAQKANTGEGYILDDLQAILKGIEQSTLGTESADDFSNLFEDLDLASTKLGKTAKERNELIAKVIVHLDEIDFDISNTESDVLGDAYEYLIGEFASGAGKKAGEFYTPQPVSTLLAQLVTIQNSELRNVYDPTCGSGSLLLRVKREAEQVGKIYGQEQNRTTYNLARMNMILHDVHYADFEIKQDDTLKRPQHLAMRFDAIVANPPFSAHWDADPLLSTTDDRFSQYGKLAPKTKADMAFVQHMLYQLSDEGTAAVVLPHGVLFRGAAEGHIRQYMIEELNAIDAVIGLPANIFYGTSIPTCILVLKKCRKNPDDILFIDASQEFEKVKTQNRLLPKHIEKIVETYKNRENIEKYSSVVNLSTIKENDYNLNIPRYVDTFEAEEAIDLDAVAQEIQTLALNLNDIDVEIARFCKELGIDAPIAGEK
ncbi:type I restriction-modification system subunit M (plasmid) [Wohlfahrtiimonas chitiniclastica]|uniref:type I restriction-modification system subunit M n=1 Tax=Wohlfahrtiimonas chitiniclastica TaxID=400946 RepID=UPI0007B402B4|nr:type I restriction-modification system subunit M [Wohlfahrtiimonas chitiniclastica]KZS22122.1 type I restriction-modification system subunit M [Wohlfahrtiimonas chitiniclastica]WHR56390.1 type I restriction-modification system subunit M [Wohlfahrtiimonas chitiniclastica]